MWVVVGVVMAVVLVATYLTWTAARVDRLHARAAAAFSALDANLVRRAAAVLELSERRGEGDLQTVAKAALAAHPDDRELAENDLTRALRKVATPAAVLTDRDPLHVAIVASRRVELARQVHNDLVRDARSARRRPLVRLLGLSRRHPEPRFFDIDDPSLE